jgi:hypothetical protein
MSENTDHNQPSDWDDVRRNLAEALPEAEDWAARVRTENARRSTPGRERSGTPFKGEIAESSAGHGIAQQPPSGSGLLDRDALVSGRAAPSSLISVAGLP